MKKGFTLLFAVLVTSLLLAVTLSVLSMSTKQVAISAIGRDSQVAFYAADSGAECIKYWDITADAFSTSSPLSQINCAGSASTVTRLNPPTEPVLCATGRGNCVQYQVDFDVVAGANVPHTSIIVEKNIATNETQLDSYGRNTGLAGSSRKVERAVEVTYTYNRRGLCGYLDVVFVVDVTDSLSQKVVANGPDAGKNGFTILKEALVAAVTAMKNRTDAEVHVSLAPFSNPGGSRLSSHLDASLEDLTNDINSFSNPAPGGADLLAGLTLASYELLGMQVPGEYYQIAFNDANYLIQPAEDPNVHDRDDSFYPDAIVVITGSQPSVYISDIASSMTHKTAATVPEKNTVKQELATFSQSLRDNSHIPIFVIGVEVPEGSEAESILMNNVASPGFYLSTHIEDAGAVKGLKTLLDSLTTCSS